MEYLLNSCRHKGVGRLQFLLATAQLSLCVILYRIIHVITDDLLQGRRERETEGREMDRDGGGVGNMSYKLLCLIKLT